MPTLAPSVLAALPAATHTHTLADLEAAYQLRRAKYSAHVDASLLAGRILASLDRFDARHPRRPRDGRGRLLSRAWLAAAESISPVDVAFFRSPLTSTEGK